ncbi:MAG TPA: MBL fold metallo-hydrolase [Caulobacteraceae bacterium]|nr:MBL fold metallo-hydrolase [Caulobacteraceae bacterium]
MPGLKLSFHGAAGCVTGFCARLQTDEAVILVDCGMFQGTKSLKALNYQPFPFDAREIDAVLLTHAHIDHSGLLPKLMRAGFHGPIFSTAGTRDLCRVMLADAGGIQESEVRQLNRRNLRRGRAEVQPIYTVRDAAKVMDQFQKVKLGEPAQVASGITATYWEAGHLLGSASIEIVVDGRKPARLLFSGDLGPGGRDYLPDPEGPCGVDHLIVESTYGDRERARLSGDERRKMLLSEVLEARAAGGPLLIPAFAVERSQELLADLLSLMEQGAMPDADIFLDSPLAIEATEIFRARGWNRETGLNPFQSLRATDRLKFMTAPGESDRLERISGWHIIVAASGMCDAGRVRKHLKRLLWQQRATVLLSGYQAAGTLGRLLQEGARRVSIQGDDIQVKARIRSLDVYSAHADALALVDWVKARMPVAGSLFLAHGEPTALQALQSRLQAAGIAPASIQIAELDQTFDLENPAAARASIQPRLANAGLARADWHNARAAVLMRLNDLLEAAPDDAARDAIVGRLTRALAMEAQPS